MAREYAAAQAFRKALEERLHTAAETELIEISRLRRQVAFDRLLARLFRAGAVPWVLKGGYALELRFRTARATVDIDLTVARAAAAGDKDTNQAVREMLQDAASVSLGDWFEYIIGPPILDLDAAPYGGARFPVEARMDSRVFARFHLDAGIGDAVIQPVDVVECRDWLSFASLPAPRVQVISREQQFAEKVHAYTLPRLSTNSRVKDLVDLALLTRSAQLNTDRAAEALRVTFARRRTHELPTILSAPPRDWQARFQALAEECQIEEDMEAAFNGVASFFHMVVL